MGLKEESFIYFINFHVENAHFFTMDKYLDIGNCKWAKCPNMG